MRRELQPLRMASSRNSAICGIDLARKRRSRRLTLPQEGFRGTPNLSADRARGAMQPALPDVRHPVPAGWPALRTARLHGLRQVHRSERHVDRIAGIAPARAGGADDAPPIL